MKRTSFDSSFRWLAPLLAVSWFTTPLRAAQETELKDDTGKTIIRYVVESPEGLAPAGTTDPTRQVGLFLCFPEHDRPTGDEILPVRESLKRQGIDFILNAKVSKVDRKDGSGTCPCASGEP